MLTLKKDHLHWESLKSDCQFYVDYLDIVAANKLQIPNQEAIDHSEKFIKDNYRYDFVL